MSTDIPVIESYLIRCKYGSPIRKFSCILHFASTSTKMRYFPPLIQQKLWRFTVGCPSPEDPGSLVSVGLKCEALSKHVVVITKADSLKLKCGATNEPS